MMNWKERAFYLSKLVAVRTPLRRLYLPTYRYMFRPMQLAFLVQCLDDTRHLNGNVTEIGCAYGDTTLYLNAHLDDLATPTTVKYICVDTFGGFLEEDVATERDRGHGGAAFEDFRVNHKEFFDATMEFNRVTRVSAFESDAKKFPFEEHGPYRFVLLDVDLYDPCLVTLRKVRPLMQEGGIIVVDDCAGGKFDGALAAYNEFCAELRCEPTIVCGKLGVVQL
jgi:O-methyltransferase